MLKTSASLPLWDSPEDLNLASGITAPYWFYVLLLVLSFSGRRHHNRECTRTVCYSPISFSNKRFNDDGQLVLDDVEVAGHGCRDQRTQLASSQKNTGNIWMKKMKFLTSDVLHGDGEGRGHFTRQPEGFVAQLLVNQRSCKTTRRNEEQSKWKQK